MSDLGRSPASYRGLVAHWRHHATSTPNRDLQNRPVPPGRYSCPVRRTAMPAVTYRNRSQNSRQSPSRWQATWQSRRPRGLPHADPPFLGVSILDLRIRVLKATGGQPPRVRYLPRVAPIARSGVTVFCSGPRLKAATPNSPHAFPAPSPGFVAGVPRCSRWLRGVAGQQLGQRAGGRGVQVKACGAGQATLEPQVELIL